MNPLTSIRQLWPGMASTPAGAASPVDPAGISIPAAELRALNAGLPAGSAKAAQASDSSFAGLLNQMVQEVNTKQQVAGQALEDLQSGQNVSLHQAVIAMEEANVSFQLMVEVRNRLLDSYQELMRIQV